MSEESSQAETRRGSYFAELVGSKVVSIEPTGGSKYGQNILILLDNGKTFRIEAELLVSIYGIRPQLKYEVGGWFKGPDKESPNRGG